MSHFPPPPPGAERRVHQRVDVLAQVELMWSDAVVVASVNNLSLGGAFLLHGDDDVAVGEEVLIHLTAGSVDVVQKAKVVRVSTAVPRGFAVSWIEPQVRTFAIISALVREETTRMPVIPAAIPPAIPPAKVSRTRSKSKKKSKSATVRRP